MRVETTKHKQHLVSLQSREVADRWRDAVTSEQYEVLKGNVYTLEECDAVYDKYHGCGCGWVEINKKGQPVGLNYLDLGLLDVVGNGYEEWEDEYEPTAIIADDMKEACLRSECGDINNAVSIAFDEGLLEPLVLDNGNIRLLVNLSCCQLIRF